MKRYTKAFTLVELLVVLSIISMLSSVVLVALQGARDKGRIGSIVTFATYNYHKLGSDMIFFANFNEGSGAPLDQSNNFTTAVSIGRVSSFSAGSAFDAQNQVNRLTYTPSIPRTLSNASYAYSLWVNRNNAALDSGVSYEYLLVFNNDGSGRQIYHNGTNTTCWQQFGVAVPNALIYDSKWHHIFCNFDTKSGQLSMYIDGKLIGSVATSNSLFQLQDFTIGNGMTNNYKFKGLIDDVQIFAESLTAMEVRAIYAEGRNNHQLALQ
jgi:prepilin-type N-terminal cleavage/methylation domain-containing protein